MGDGGRRRPDSLRPSGKVAGCVSSVRIHYRASATVALLLLPPHSIQSNTNFEFAWTSGPATSGARDVLRGRYALEARTFTDDRFRSLRTCREAADLDFEPVLQEREVILGRSAQPLKSGDPLGRAAPARQFLVDRLDLRILFGDRRHPVERCSLEPVADANRNRV